MVGFFFRRIFKSDTNKEAFENMALINQIDDCSVLGLLADENNVWIITNKRCFNIIFIRSVCMNYATSDGTYGLMYSDTER